MVPDGLRTAAQEVVDAVHQNTPFPYLMAAKLGDAENGPMLDAETAARNDTPFYTIAIRWKDIVQDLIKTDHQHGNPLHTIARRANDIIVRAGILNRHNRRPPLYAEATIKEFIELGLATPEHSPLIRASGHVTPPPVFPLNHDLGTIIKDIATHMARSHEPQSVIQILQSLEHRRKELDRWPQLDLPLFILRTAGIPSDDQGIYYPEQPWGGLLSPQRLVTSTVIRIFKRDQEPRTTTYLVTETERLAGQFLPERYNTLAAVRATTSKSEEISWQGRSTFGLREWDTALDTRNKASTRGSTADVIYAFLMDCGPTDIENVINHVQSITNVQRRTVQEAINHDGENRFIRIPNAKVAANPVPEGHNRRSRSLTVVSEKRECEPITVLRESELTWLTRYLQGLNELTPPLPSRVAITGARAAGFAHEGDALEVTVVADQGHWPDLDPRLSDVAAAATEAVPSVRPHVRIQSPENWDRHQTSENTPAHHNVWLAPDRSPKYRRRP